MSNNNYVKTIPRQLLTTPEATNPDMVEDKASHSAIAVIQAPCNLIDATELDPLTQTRWRVPEGLFAKELVMLDHRRYRVRW